MVSMSVFECCVQRAQPWNHHFDWLTGKILEDIVSRIVWHMQFQMIFSGVFVKRLSMIRKKMLLGLLVCFWHCHIWNWHESPATDVPLPSLKCFAKTFCSFLPSLHVSTQSQWTSCVAHVFDANMQCWFHCIVLMLKNVFESSDELVSHCRRVLFICRSCHWVQPRICNAKLTADCLASQQSSSSRNTMLHSACSPTLGSVLP